MLAEDQLIDSRKISGLIVRGHEEDSPGVPLPITYTWELIPVNRSHIPTAAMAERWPHSENVAKRLLPLKDYDLGFIGYNCPRALALREVIPPCGDGPYAERTDLG